MISVYNKAIVKELNPSLLEKLEEIETKGLQHVAVIPSKSGEKTITIEEKGKTYYLESRYQPSYVAQKTIELHTKFDKTESILFYGVGLGYQIKEVLNRYPQVKYYIVEPNLEVLYAFLEQNELKDMALANLEKIDCDFSGLSSSIPRFLIKYSGTLKVIGSKNTIEFFPEKYEEFKKKLLLAMRKERDSADFFVKEQIRTVINELENMPKVLTTGNILYQDLSEIKGKTAIIAAAGPSLEDEIENLREIKEKGMAYIFAVGSAVNSLISRNIHPDAVFSYDPSFENQRVLQKIKDEKITDIPLIYGAGLGYESLHHYPGTMFHMLTTNNVIMDNFLKAKEGQLTFINVGATITIAALDSVLKMGFGEVILVGQNLGITETKAYSSGIDYVTDEIIVASQYTEIEKDVEGNPMRTSTPYIMMREGLELITNHTESKAKIWNATKKGLAIAGTEFKPLDQLMENMSTGAVTNRWLQNNNNNKYDLEHLEQQYKAIVESEQDVETEFSAFQGILSDIKKQADLGLYSKLRKLYVKLNLRLERLEKNKYSELYLLSSMVKEYHNLIVKIEVFNSIKDPIQQYQEIYKNFYEFAEVYEDRMKQIKPYSQKMNEFLQDYIVKQKENLK